MTESPFVKAEGPEPPDVVDFLGKEHQKAMAKVNATNLDQIAKQSAFRVSNTSGVISAEVKLSHQRNKLMATTDELNRVMNTLGRAEARLFDAYQLIGQLVGYLDSIEWGTHDEWTRSQSLRERVREYITGSNTIAT